MNLHSLLSCFTCSNSVAFKLTIFHNFSFSRGHVIRLFCAEESNDGQKKMPLFMAKHMELKGKNLS